MRHREPSIVPRTLEEAEFVREQGERQRAQARGEWLPEGWVWDEWPVEGVGMVEGACCGEPGVFVYLLPPGEGEHVPKIHMAGAGGAPPVVFTMVFNRWLARRRG
jgi:hypothetical protein